MPPLLAVAESVNAPPDVIAVVVVMLLLLVMMKLPNVSPSEARLRA